MKKTSLFLSLIHILQEAKEPTLPELLGKYLDLRREERTGWTSKGQLKGTVNDFNKVGDMGKHGVDLLHALFLRPVSYTHLDVYKRQ